MAIIRRVAFCPHCNNRAPQTLIHSQPYDMRGYSMIDDSEEFMPATYHIVSCDTCHEILVYSDFADRYGAENFEHSDLVWPQRKTLHESVPKDIKRIYEEAALIERSSPDAFAVQIRRGLEAVCIDRGVEERNLHQALEQLAAKGEIPPTLAEFTDVLRLLGNIGAHWTGKHVHPLQTFALDDFFRAIIEYIYVAPSKLKEFRNRLAEFGKYGDVDKFKS